LKQNTTIPFSAMPGCFKEKICQYTSLNADALLTVERATEVETDNVTYAIGDIFVIALIHECLVMLTY